jgi:SnoaL-like domain
METDIRPRALYTGEFTAFEGKSSEQRLQELMDREELRELIACYAHRVAQGVSVASLFTHDGLYIVRRPGRPPVEKRGRAQLDENFAQLDGNGGQMMPMLHNFLLQIRGDEAAGLCSNELRMTESAQSIIGGGYYRDSFRRERGRWRFTVRDMTFFHWVPIQQGWAGQGS